MKIENGRVKIVGSSVAFENLPLATTNHVLYTINNPDYLPLDPTMPFELKIGLDALDVLDTYKVNYDRGEIMFDKMEDRTGMACSGSYLPTATFGMIEGISYDTKVTDIDATFINDEQERFLAGKKSTTVTIDAFYTWDESLEGYFTADQLFQIEIEVNGNIKTVLGFFDQNTMSANSDDAIKTNLKFIGRQ